MLTHVDENNQPSMVDIADKNITWRSASAGAKVFLPEELRAHLSGKEINTKKGPVFQTAIIAGTMAVKRTADLIPFCHPIPLDSCKIGIQLNDDMSVDITSHIKVFAKTGAEMEALTAVNIAALTIFDMCKAVSSDIRIGDIGLISKTGGKSTKLDKPLYGLVLTGGKSTRMGKDKALLQYSGSPQAVYLRELLAPFCKEVFLSTRENQWAGTELEKLPQLVDQVEGLGPIGGILTALESQPEANWFVVACDLPFVTKEAVQKLLADFDSKAVATCYANAEKGFPEALFAIYSPAALSAFKQALADGVHCPVKVLRNSTVKIVKADRSVNLANINTPEEFAHAQGVL